MVAGRNETYRGNREQTGVPSSKKHISWKGVGHGAMELRGAGMQEEDGWKVRELEGGCVPAPHPTHSWVRHRQGMCLGTACGYVHVCT